MASEHMQDIRAGGDNADMIMRIYLEQITRVLASDTRTSSLIVK